MPEHFRAFSAVFPVLLRQGDRGEEVLLLRRANTGYMDGWWDFAGSGHVDEGETATQAVCRESREELGITVEPGAVTFLHLNHRLAERTYYDIYFRVERWTGTPAIREPEKCSALAWFPLEALPEDMIPIRRRALSLARAGGPYSETAYPAPEEGEKR